MHIRKNIMKIPFWGYYFLQDAWIKKRLKKITRFLTHFQPLKGRKNSVF